MIAYTIFLGVIILIWILHFIAGKKSNGWNVWEDLCGFYLFLGIFCTSLFILVTMISFPIGKANDRAKMRDIRVFVQTLDTQRKAGNNLENATLTSKIIEYNQWIAEAKRDNSSFWLYDWWTDDAVDTLKMIK